MAVVPVLRKVKTRLKNFGPANLYQKASLEIFLKCLAHTRGHIPLHKIVGGFVDCLIFDLKKIDKDSKWSASII